MKPAEYWCRRSEEVAARQFAKADAYQAELAREYARATEEIRRAIEVFYQRYAENGEVSMAEARRQLSGSELRRFKMTLEEFTEKAKNNADGRWTKQLNEVYYRVRVSRYEALLTEIQQQVELLAGSRQRRTGRLLSDVYEDTYYRTVYEIQRGTGFGATFAKVDQETLEKVLGTQFAGSNWSKRIWGDRDKLIGELRTRLAQAFIRGESAERTARELAQRMGVSLSNAERLVQTETAFFVGEATLAAYKASGVVDRYEFLATLDSRTTEICRAMDGKVFKLSEREIGVNYPPLHARCRSTVVPYFEDEEDVGERIARDATGRTYHVPGDMTYKQWYNEHILSAKPPRTRRLDNSVLPKALRVDRTGDIWIPGNAIIENVHVIAGKGVATPIRAVDSLVNKYGGRPEDWEKVVGLVKSDKYEFDIHWYQNGEKAVEHKIKSFKERRTKNT